MRYRLAVLPAAAVLSGAVFVGGSGAPAAAHQPAPHATAPGSGKVKIGDTLTLHGMKDNEKITVTLRQWRAPAVGADEFNKPSPGKKWVAAQVELKNTGSAEYSDSPTNGMQVADSQGQHFDTWIGAELAAGPTLDSGVKLSKGEKALGWAVFQVPSNSRIVTMQFTMDSGFADQTGEWKLVK